MSYHPRRWQFASSPWLTWRCGRWRFGWWRSTSPWWLRLRMTCCLLTSSDDELIWTNRLVSPRRTTSFLWRRPHLVPRCLFASFSFQHQEGEFYEMSLIMMMAFFYNCVDDVHYDCFAKSESLLGTSLPAVEARFEDCYDGETRVIIHNEIQFYDCGEEYMIHLDNFLDTPLTGSVFLLHLLVPVMQWDCIHSILNGPSVSTTQKQPVPRLQVLSKFPTVSGLCSQVLSW